MDQGIISSSERLAGGSFQRILGKCANTVVGPSGEPEKHKKLNGAVYGFSRSRNVAIQIHTIIIDASSDRD